MRGIYFAKVTKVIVFGSTYKHEHKHERVIEDNTIVITPPCFEQPFKPPKKLVEKVKF